MDNILGIDLGSGSIGIALRNEHAGPTMKEQLQYFSSDIFQSGVGKEKNVEYSFAAERTKNRQSRRLYETRRRKLWATLALLIENDYCPMDPQSLKQWSTYNKEQGLTRQYPIHDKAFDQWIKLDFNGDGKPDFSTPYQLRRLLIEEQLDFSKAENRYKLGRAIYHIAQHRGFKSSKGETIKESDSSKKGDEGLDVAQEMKKSETKLSKGIVEYMKQHDLKTVGQAFAYLELDGERIRNNATYKAVRSQYVDEIKAIFDFQDGLDVNSEFCTRLLSTKKGEGTLFYKKPLRSQKGLVGKCTLEPSKNRCPASHPYYEIFKAWSILNNIKCRKDANHEMTPLTIEQKEDIFFTLFVSRVKSNFQFVDIKKYIEKNVLHAAVSNETGCAINYKDNQSFDGCPITARLYRIFAPLWGVEKGEWKGTQWLIKKLNENIIQGTKQRTAHGAANLCNHKVMYSPIDVWHICYEADEPEDVLAVANNRLQLDEETSKELLRIWSAIPQGYSSLSLKAITNINAFLIQGLKYNDATLLAKIPEIAHINSQQAIDLVSEFNENVRSRIDHQTQVTAIVNNLIANYKALLEDEQFAFKNYDYQLDEKDKNDVVKAIEGFVGPHTWGEMDAQEQLHLIGDVEKGYQAFFKSHERSFMEKPKMDEAFKEFLSNRFPEVNPDKWEKLYHHSDISLYPVLSNGSDRSKWRLGSPNIGSIRNPVVLRTLNKLRRKINTMLDAGMISYDDTRLVVETAREFNDANMRWAINTYREQREAENKQIRAILEEFVATNNINKSIGEIDIDRARYMMEQGDNEMLIADKPSDTYSKVKDRDIKKYKLWLEQNCVCMYTGKIISLAQLFDDNAFDIEHTIPRSLSFDNSDQNLTVCDSHYNRAVKKNQIPTQLPNYEKTATIDGVSYSPIIDRLEKWEKRVERLKENIDYWVAQSRRASTKERKDQCIRQRHLWRMEYDYWRRKLERFTMQEVKDGFKNSQLVDTRIITKYATLYLKSVFNRVDVQKGSDTAEFRKILGIQSIEEKKDRSHHSHHAIDAAVLTLIPTHARAKKMRQLFAEIEEAEKLGKTSDANIKRNALDRELKACNIGKDAPDMGSYIDENILINQHATNKALLPDMNHGVVGKPQKLVVKGRKRIVWAQGDSIRGRLHKETFFGAVQLPQTEGTGLERTFAMREGRFVYPKTEDKFMVVRKLLVDFTNEKDFEAIVDPKLRQIISKTIKERLAQGASFKEAIAQDIWMIDHDGNEIKTDRKGRPLRPIRHIRCLVKAGRGYMTYEKSLQIRKQNHISNKRLVNIANRDYKYNVYAQNDTNQVFLLYEGIKGGKVVRKSRIISLFELSQSFKGKIITDYYSYFSKEPYYASITEKGVDYKLTAAIEPGTRVLLWNESPEEINDIKHDTKELSKRLYVVYKFNNTGTDRLYLLPHISSDEDSEIQFVATTFNCLIEHRDFRVDVLGNIVLIND